MVPKALKKTRSASGLFDRNGFALAARVTCVRQYFHSAPAAEDTDYWSRALPNPIHRRTRIGAQRATTPSSISQLAQARDVGPHVTRWQPADGGGHVGFPRHCFSPVPGQRIRVSHARGRRRFWLPNFRRTLTWTTSSNKRVPSG
jgi:hypothetical protein